MLAWWCGVVRSSPNRFFLSPVEHVPNLSGLIENPRASSRGAKTRKPTLRPMEEMTRALQRQRVLEELAGIGDKEDDKK